MSTSTVELLGVSHAYGRTQALRDVSLAVAPGEVVAVTGPSGCGKSTLLMLAAGVLRTRSGRVVLAGTDLADADEATRARIRRRSVGIVLQFGQLVPDLPVLDNVALPLLLEGRARLAPPPPGGSTGSAWTCRPRRCRATSPVAETRNRG